MVDFKIKISEHVFGGVNVLVGDRELLLGEVIPSEWGFEDSVRIDRRLLQIVAFLALRKHTRPQNDWVDAVDLDLIHGAGFGTATTQYLAKKLRGYPPWIVASLEDESEVEVDDLPRERLIHYMPNHQKNGLSRGGHRGGKRSGSGRYRLGAELSDDFSVETAWRLVFGSAFEATPLELDFDPGHASQIIEHSRLIFHERSIVEARRFLGCHLHRLLHDTEKPVGWDEENIRKRFYKEQQRALAMMLRELAQFDMEMRRSYQAIAAASLSERIHRLIKNNKERVDALLTLSNAYGQLSSGDIEAKNFAELAYRVSQNTRAIKSNKFEKALISAERGRRQAVSGYLRKGHKALKKSIETCCEEGHQEWGAVWSLRRAELYLNDGDVDCAKKMLSQASELAPLSTLTHAPQRALMTRVRASYAAYVGDWDELLSSARESIRIRLLAGMHTISVENILISSEKLAPEEVRELLEEEREANQRT